MTERVPPRFEGLRVLLLESRRATELASLVTTYGGIPIVAPSMREVPLDSNHEALAFADALQRGEFDIVILLTGVGTKALVSVVERARGSREAFVEALRRTKVAVRGPKPAAVLRELQVPMWVTAPEPNTWRELLASMDAAVDDRGGGPSGRPWDGTRVAIQEYGEPNQELLEALESRGARVTRVPVYQWALPEDTGPLEDAARTVANGGVDVALFTTGTQVVHLLKIADRLGIGAGVRDGLRRVVVASIGPTTSEELRRQGIGIDMEPSHPKMGFLAREAAERAATVLAAKRAP